MTRQISWKDSSSARPPEKQAGQDYIPSPGKAEARMWFGLAGTTWRQRGTSSVPVILHKQAAHILSGIQPAASRVWLLSLGTMLFRVSVLSHPSGVSPLYCWVWMYCSLFRWWVSGLLSGFDSYKQKHYKHACAGFNRGKLSRLLSSQPGPGWLVHTQVRALLCKKLPECLSEVAAPLSIPASKVSESSRLKS